MKYMPMFLITAMLHGVQLAKALQILGIDLEIGAAAIEVILKLVNLMLPKMLVSVK